MNKIYLILTLLFCSNTIVLGSTTPSLNSSMLKGYYHVPPSIIGGFSFRSLFDEPLAFDKGTFIFCLGAGFKSNIGITGKSSKLVVPPLLVITEFPIYPNIGIGFSAGGMQWRSEKDSDLTYSYYTFSPRLAYHLNIHEQVDFYSGVSLSGRMSNIKIEDASGTFRRYNFDVGAHIGLRFFIKPAFGVFAEYGSDGPACFKAGIAFRTGH